MGVVRHNVSHQVIKDEAPEFRGDHDSDTCEAEELALEEEVRELDSGDEVDDEGGMSEHRTLPFEEE